MAALPTNGAATRPSIFPQLSLNAELWCDTGGTPMGGTPSLPQVFRGDGSPRNTSEDRQGVYSNPQLNVGTEGTCSDSEALTCRDSAELAHRGAFTAVPAGSLLHSALIHATFRLLAAVDSL